MVDKWQLERGGSRSRAWQVTSNAELVVVQVRLSAVTEWLCFTSVHPLHIIYNLPAVTISLFPFVACLLLLMAQTSRFYVSVLHVSYEHVMDTKSNPLSLSLSRQEAWLGHSALQ